MNRILVIDDDPQVREMLNLILEWAGYEVILASDGKGGIRLFHENPVGLVITDIVMPDKDGLETIMELRRFSPGVKIIAISGGGKICGEEYLNVARILGVEKTLSKPFKIDDILEAVREVF